jgi:Uncharacterized conserved protein (DUF2249)
MLTTMVSHMEMSPRLERRRVQLRQIITHGGPVDGVELLDLRELPAPEPFEQALLTASALVAGQGVVVWTPRVPRLLFPALAERGLLHVVEACDDGTALVYIERP